MDEEKFLEKLHKIASPEERLKWYKENEDYFHLSREDTCPMCRVEYYRKYPNDETGVFDSNFEIRKKWVLDNPNNPLILKSDITEAIIFFATNNPRNKELKKCGLVIAKLVYYRANRNDFDCKYDNSPEVRLFYYSQLQPLDKDAKKDSDYRIRLIYYFTRCDDLDIQKDSDYTVVNLFNMRNIMRNNEAWDDIFSKTPREYVEYHCGEINLSDEYQ